jgi:ergothioneine biosynthesis protein EgtB
MNNLIERFKQVRRQSEELCKPLKTEDYVVQPVEFVSPPKWNIAHVTWFFEEFILKPYHRGYREYNPQFAYFFNSYYESVGKRTFRADRGNMTRPTVEEVYAYRKYVDESLIQFIDSQVSLSQQILDLIELGLNHEQQHQELLMTDLKYVLAHNPLFPPYLDTKPALHLNLEAKQNSRDAKHFVAEGLYTVGYEGKDFHFDNEKGVHKVWLPAYTIQKHLVTVMAYLEFMEAGAYQKFQYWLSAGWEWVKSQHIESPLYWHKIEGQWYHYTLYGLEKLDLNAPITHISFYEADAFARWAGMRLPTEFEWETACKQAHDFIPTEANFLEDKHLHPMASTSHHQFYGDVWEWTNSAYLPYPYYKQAEGAIGEYNGKFMINQMVLRGGSCVSPRSHIRATYRNFFHAHERWQFTGIRLAEYV